MQVHLRTQLQLQLLQLLVAGLNSGLRQRRLHRQMFLWQCQQLLLPRLPMEQHVTQSAVT